VRKREEIVAEEKLESEPKVQKKRKKEN